MKVAESRRYTIHVTNLESEAFAWHSGFWKFAVRQSRTSLYLQAQLSLNGGISKKANWLEYNYVEQADPWVDDLLSQNLKI